jgi:hypothetical protein
MTTDVQKPDDFEAHCMAELGPLFDVRRYQMIDTLLEIACCLVRAGGIEDKDWDPIIESGALVADLQQLADSHLDALQFPHPDRTRARLALLMYCHVTEADFFYHSLANVLRIDHGSKYSIDPFLDLWTIRKNQRIPPPLGKKIKRVSDLAAAKHPGVTNLIDRVYFKDIRNSVFHADYTLTDEQFRMRHGLYTSASGTSSMTIPLDELNSIIRRGLTFYSSIMTLHARARRQFSGLRNTILPFDSHYKGLLEFLFENDSLCGFRTYWPNGSMSDFIRNADGCRGQNIYFDDDDSINFMVGLYATKRGAFSPLVEHDSTPQYPAMAGRTEVLHWPADRRPYTV